MSVIAAAIISFFSFILITLHLKRDTIRKIAGFALYIDLFMHGSIIMLFIGTSTLGLLQAELSAILFSIALRTYRWAIGYRKLTRQGLRLKWVLVPGRFSA